MFEKIRAQQQTETERARDSFLEAKRKSDAANAELEQSLNEYPERVARLREEESLKIQKRLEEAKAQQREAEERLANVDAEIAAEEATKEAEFEAEKARLLKIINGD